VVAPLLLHDVVHLLDHVARVEGRLCDHPQTIIATIFSSVPIARCVCVCGRACACVWGTEPKSIWHTRLPKLHQSVCRP
jgi:hypothetical protein